MPRKRGAKPRKSDSDLDHQTSPAAAYDDQVEPEKTAGSHEVVLEGVGGNDPSLIHLNVRSQDPISEKKRASFIQGRHTILQRLINECRDIPLRFLGVALCWRLGLRSVVLCCILESYFALSLSLISL